MSLTLLRTWLRIHNAGVLNYRNTSKAHTVRTVFVTNLAFMTAIGLTALAAEREPTAHRSAIEFEGREWRYTRADRVAVEEYRGKTALLLNGGNGNSVYLPDVEFRDGTIEVDIAALDRSLPGIGFRGRENGYWRNVVFFNRWRGTENDKCDVVEQAAITHRTGTNLVLNIRTSASDGIHTRPDLCEWFHVKIVVLGSSVTVYLNDSQEPSFAVGAMLDVNEKGVLGLCGGDCYFANFRYTTDVTK